MPELLFKSRSGNERGKQKVFFSCHPADFDLYFEQLTNEVLQIVDCAVYYYPPGVEVRPDEDYFLNLQDMQLFLMPVTKKLLQGNNRTLEADLPFARARNIPMLPIQCESGLEAAFSNVCGHWQLLDRMSRDETAIPYEEKLADRLRSTILGEELVSRVREAFDAYLFLSYRKMDRVYARALMRKLHRTDLCRDVAIWYDERLVLGEDFDEGILDAMKKSKLVLLAVTPNLLALNQFGEKNYVMGTEYPKARELGLPVLPVELVPTERQALRENFAELPDCIDAADDRTLEAALAAYLQVPTGGKREKDPLHEFLIGLAYLNGIDMDVDRQKGLALLTGAAEAGLTEAMCKLKEMYLYADGVDRDVSKAVYWTHRLAQALEEDYQKNHTKAGGESWAKSLWDLGDYLNELGKSTDAIGVYSRMCLLCESLLSQWESLELRRMSAIGHAKLASCVRDHAPEDAEDFYRTAIRHCLVLQKEGYMPARTAWDLAMFAMRLGTLLTNKDPMEALKWFVHAETLFRDALDKSESDQYQSRVKRNLAMLYMNVGRLFSSAGQMEKAKNYMQQAIGIEEQLYSEKYTPAMLNVVRDLGACHWEVGNLFHSNEQSVPAAMHFLKGYGYCRQAYQFTRSQQDAAMLHSISNSLNQVYMHLKVLLEQGVLPPEAVHNVRRLMLDIFNALYGQ